MHPSSGPKSDSEIVEQFYDAINRFDLESAMDLCDEGIVRIEPEGFPTAGTYQGKAEVLAHLAQGRGSWEEGSCSPESLVVAFDKIVANLHVVVRKRGSRDWIEGRFADVLTFRNGKITGWRSFGERQGALDWAMLPS